MQDYSIGVTPTEPRAWNPELRARPTVYKGIRMRSRLEASYAALLDRCGRQWEYEPCCYAGPDGQYLPDFVTFVDRTSGPPGLVITEVKPFVPPGLVALQRRMSVVWLSEPSAVLEIAVFSDGGYDRQWLGGRGEWREYDL